MAGLLFMEGFETFGANGDTGAALQDVIKAKWPQVILSTSAKLSDDAYDGQGLCLDCVWGSTSYRLGLNTNVASKELIVGFAWYTGTLTAYYLYWGTNAGTQMSLYAYTDGHFRIYHGATFTDTGVGLFTADTWHYVEIKFKVDGTNGYWELYIDNQLVASDSGIPTYSTFYPAEITTHSFGIRNTNARFDDIYIYDNTGDVQEPFGPVKIRALLPDGDDTTDWSSTGANHYDQVNDLPVDTANYVESNTANDVDLFTFANAADPSNWPIYGVQLNVYAAVTDVGLFTLDGIADSNGSQDTNSEVIVDHLGGQYRFVFEDDPETSNAWTWDQLNDAKFGVGVG